MNWKRSIVIGVLCVVGVAGVASAMRPRPRRIEAGHLARGPMVVEVESDGRTRVRDRYVISAPLAGHLARIELHPGDEVRAGAVVARLLPAAAPLLDARSMEEAQGRLSAAQDALRQEQSGAERARIALEYARREAVRQRQLVERDAVPRQAVELADLDVRTREAELASAGFAVRVAAHQAETAQAAVGRLRAPTSPTAPGVAMEVTAPVTGRVLRVMQQSAGIVGAGAQLLEVGDPEALEVVADVLTSEAVHIPPNARVRLARWGGDEELEARVRLVEPSAFTHISALGVEEQRVNVIADITSPPAQWRTLGDGYRVTAYVEVWRRDDALRVPVGSLFRDGEAWAVFTVEGGRARRHAVRVGRRNAADAEVLGGLRGNEVLVAHPDDTIDEGTAVDAR